MSTYLQTASVYIGGLWSLKKSPPISFFAL